MKVKLSHVQYEHEFETAITNLVECKNIRANPAGNYIFKVNNKNSKARREICPKLTIKTPERHQWRRSDVFIVNFEHISQLGLVLLLLTLNM